MATSVDAPAPGPAEGVGHDHRRPRRPRRARRPSRMRRAERSESSGQQGGPAALDVGEVDAGVGADEAVAGLGHDRSPRRRRIAHRLLLHEPPCATAGRRGRPRTRRPSALETTFWVTTTTSPSTQARRARRSASARSSPGPDLGQSRRRGSGCDVGHRPAPLIAASGRRRPASSTTRARAAASAGPAHDGRGHDAAHAGGLDRAGRGRRRPRRSTRVAAIGA